MNMPDKFVKGAMQAIDLDSLRSCVNCKNNACYKTANEKRCMICKGWDKWEASNEPNT